MVLVEEDEGLGPNFEQIEDMMWEIHEVPSQLVKTSVLLLTNASLGSAAVESKSEDVNMAHPGSRQPFQEGGDGSLSSPGVIYPKRLPREALKHVKLHS